MLFTGAVIRSRSVSTNCIGLACTGHCCHEIIHYECNGYGKNMPGVF